MTVKFVYGEWVYYLTPVAQMPLVPLFIEFFFFLFFKSNYILWTFMIMSSGM